MSKASEISSAPTVRRSSQPSGGAYRRPPARKPTSPLYYIFVSLGILLGLLVSVLSIGFFVGSFIMMNVLNQIALRSFDAPMERIESYELFFKKIATENFGVKAEDPKINQGVTNYLWQITPRGIDDIVSFQWQHDLESNEVTPRNNAALLLDVKLGYETDQQARQKYGFYNPDDPLARAVVAEEFELLAPSDDGRGWADRLQQNLAALPAPLMTPEEAKRRKGAKMVKTEEEEEPVEEPAEGEPVIGANGEVLAPPVQQSPDGDSTEVGEESEEQAGGEGQEVVQPEDPEPPAEEDPAPPAEEENEEEEEPEPPAEEAIPVR